MEVGFVGLGKMGRPMTQRLLAAGHTVYVFNRSRPAIDALVAEGAKPASSAADVAQHAQVVMTALPTPESVEAVFREMTESAHQGQIYIDHGVSLDAVLAASRYIVDAVGHPLTSKVYQAGGRLKTIPAPR